MDYGVDLCEFMMYSLFSVAMQQQKKKDNNQMR